MTPIRLGTRVVVYGRLGRVAALRSPNTATVVTDGGSVMTVLRDELTVLPAYL